jgi:hypothetical protein
MSLEFSGLQEGETPPSVVVEALDREGQTIHREEVSEGGDISLPADVLEKANKLTISAADADEGAEPAIIVRAREVRKLVEEGTPLRISRSQWGRLWPFTECVDGSVKHCFPFPYLIDSLLLQSQVKQLAFPRPIRPPFWPRCEIVCDGEVIVYQRTCCCDPWIIDDPRLQDLIDRLRELLHQRPPIGWPPPPPPLDG